MLVTMTTTFTTWTINQCTTLWDFNTEFRRDKLIMIFFMHYLTAWNIDHSRYGGRIKEKYILYVSWLLTNPSPTSIHGRPLFRGHFPWSGGCPLNRGSAVYGNNLDIAKLCHSKHIFQSLDNSLYKGSTVTKLSAVPELPMKYCMCPLKIELC